MLEIVEDALEAGRVVAGAYRLERILGEGGMGVVWAATEIATGKTVALKFLRSGRASDPKNQERFLREARAAMAVDHPNVAKVHAVLETDAGVPFFVMDLLEGESLRAILKRRGTLTLAECARVFVPAAEALQAAHVLGIVHRDLKPENVFLVGGHDVRLLDFGIAKRISGVDETAPPGLTSTGALLGTPYYMAPEQIFGEEDIDARADVWALGIMLYECLAGTRPTNGVGIGPIIKKITTDTLLPLEQVAAHLPPEVTRLVGRMLSRARNDRPTLAEVREVLRRAAAVASAPTRDERRPAPAVANAPTRDERRPAPAHAAAAPIALPPSTTAGVASRRPGVGSESQIGLRSAEGLRSSEGRSAMPVAIAIGSVAVLGGVVAAAALTVTRLRARETPVPAPSTSVVTSAVVPPVTPTTSASATPPDLVTTADAGPRTGPTASAEPARADDPYGRARAAFDKRDGPTCLKNLDAYDREAPPKLKSTNPSAGASQTRALCMMMAGDCEGGKALYRRYRAAGGTSSEELLDSATEEMAARVCSGGSMSPRDQVRVADERLRSAGDGFTKASSADCQRWYDTIRKVTPTLELRGQDDPIRMIPVSLGRRAPACFARAGDCAASFRVFRDEYMRTRKPVADAAAREAAIREEYRVLADELRACRGTP